MNAPHIHLLINQLPIFGSIFDGLVLTKFAAYNLFIISSIGRGIAYFTGEAAEENVKIHKVLLKQPWRNTKILRFFTLFSLIILGISSI